MGISGWWEKRQARKQQEENAKLLELAEHPHDVDTSGTDIDEVRTEYGNSRLEHGGELTDQELRKIE
jgi:hypothetical protein